MADDVFMKITGQKQGWIKGESRKKGKEDWIIIDDYQLGASQPGSYGTNFGGSTGKTSFHDISFSQELSVATPLLFTAMTTGEAFSEVILSRRKSTGDAPEDYQVITLTDAILTSYSMSGNHLSGTINFKKINLVNKKQNDDGTLGSAIEMTFDQSLGTQA